MSPGEEAGIGSCTNTAAAYKRPSELVPVGLLAARTDGAVFELGGGSVGVEQPKPDRMSPAHLDVELESATR